MRASNIGSSRPSIRRSTPDRRISSRSPRRRTGSTSTRSTERPAASPRRAGTIALVAYHRAVIHPAVDAVIERFYGGDLDGFWPPERMHVEREYADLPFPFARIPAPRLDITVSWTVDQMLGYIRTWSAVRAMEKAHGPAAAERFATELRHVWDRGPRTVCWPIVILAGRL